MVPIFAYFVQHYVLGILSTLKHVVPNILTTIIYITWICHYLLIHLFVAYLSHYLPTVL